MISNYSASPSTVTNASPVTLTATVTDALACSLSSTPSIPDLPSGDVCTTIPSSTVNISFYLPENAQVGRYARPVRYKIKLTAVDEFIGLRNISKSAKVKVLVEPGGGGGAPPEA